MKVLESILMTDCQQQHNKKGNGLKVFLGSHGDTQTITATKSVRKQQIFYMEQIKQNSFSFLMQCSFLYKLSHHE